MTTLMIGAELSQGQTQGRKSPARHSTAKPSAHKAAWLALEALLAHQRERWLLWLPIAVILGAAVWLAAPIAPPDWAAPLGFCLTAVMAALAAWAPSPRRGPILAVRAALAGCFSLAAAVSLGASAAALRTHLVAAPRVEVEIGPVIVDGWVEEVEIGAPRTRLRVLVNSIEGVNAPPRFVRFTTPGSRAFTAGRAIRCRAVLRPPDGPLAPGAYDFARRAYFARLGATGFTHGRCRPANLEAPAHPLDRARLLLAAVRSDIAESIHAASPGPGGSVAASLIVGDRSFISEPVNEDLRDSGLGHIISVSGLHMGIVGGLAFATFTGLLALIAPLALRVPVRKLAAIGALLVLTFYLFFSGSSVPAIRAYVMACVAFGAILIDRPAISMRGLALAALIIALVLPESVLEPGFQMSFAATAALVAAFEVWPRRGEDARLPTPGPIVGGLQAIGRGLGGVLLISFVAGLATDPFALHHFQRYSVYGLPANLAAAPLVSFVIAPAAAIAGLLAPFGLAEFPLQVMAAGCDLLVGIGAALADRPEAVRALPKPPDAAFLLAVLGILWACLWKGAVRWGGAALLAGALALYATSPRPALLFDGDLRAVLARNVGGAWTYTSVFGRSTFARDRLGAMAGLSPSEMERLARPEGCAENVCELILPNGARAMLVLQEPGYADARTRGALVLSRLAAPQTVRSSSAKLIDAADLARHGGGAVTPLAGGEEGRARLAIARVHAARARPWETRSVAGAQKSDVQQTDARD
ncbi:MAG: ComEC/Rec2 family competence protein [Hyphomonadaceae bacterium]